MINWNVFLPTTFFLTFMILKKEHRLPFLLFAGLFLDKIVYDLPFLNTGLLFFFFCLSVVFSKRDHLNYSIFQTAVFTLLYYLFWMVVLQKNLVMPFFFALVWNVSFTILFYQKEKIKLK